VSLKEKWEEYCSLNLSVHPSENNSFKRAFYAGAEAVIVSGDRLCPYCKHSEHFGKTCQCECIAFPVWAGPLPRIISEKIQAEIDHFKAGKP
jgi:hypothetical protein